jgi:hypothetical protein
MPNPLNSADPQQYYIRVRGRVLGPFTVDKLKSLRSRGQFSRVHEVSTDRQNWGPASDLDPLLGVPRPAAAGEPSESPAAPAASTTSPAGAFPGASWYYNIGGEHHGPASIIELRGMVSTGKLHGDDYAWKEGMQDWLPISQIPELQRAAEPSPPIASPTVASGVNPLHDDGIHHTSGLAVASLIMGILGLLTPVLGLIFNLLAVIFGATALRAIGRSRVALGGRGLALSGLILGTIGLALWAIFLLWWFGLLAVMIAGAQGN